MDQLRYTYIIFIIELVLLTVNTENRTLKSSLSTTVFSVYNTMEPEFNEELTSVRPRYIDRSTIIPNPNKKNYYIQATPSTPIVTTTNPDTMKKSQMDKPSNFDKEAIDTLISRNNETLIGYNKGEESIEFVPSDDPSNLNPDNLSNFVKIEKDGNDYKLVEGNQNSNSPQEVPSATVQTNSTANNDSHYHPEFKSCGKFILDKEEYKILPDNTVVAYNQTYNSSFYKLDGDLLLICAPNITLTQKLKVSPKFPEVFVYITSVGIGISILFLVLHLTVFCFEKSLRNLPGWNMASMVLATLLGYILFILGQLKIIQGIPCVVIAVLTYYFFFVSFMWMNVMAFDIWRTLRMSTIKLQGPFLVMKWRRFIAYSLYSWGIPLIGVTISVIVDNVLAKNSMYRPKFGEIVCWFRQRRPLFIFFAMPIVVIITVNIIFFIMCARILVITNVSNPIENKTVVRKHYLIYVRLMVIMGLSWIFGIISGSVNFQPMWYIFIILNTLYGLFIFLAFTCNSKVKKEFRQKLVEYSRKLSTPQITMTTNTQKEDTTTQ